MTDQTIKDAFEKVGQAIQSHTDLLADYRNNLEQIIITVNTHAKVIGEMQGAFACIISEKLGRENLN